jgi:predicted component of type VI protein secretion system
MSELADDVMPPHTVLTVLAPARPGRQLPVTGERLVIGRSPTSDVVLDDGQVSRVHAVLERVAGMWTLRDVGSRNGTRVNGSRVVTQIRVRAGDEIAMGDTRLSVRDRGPGHDPDVTQATEAPPRLTPRERDVVLALFATMNPSEAFTEPASTSRIAQALWISDGAVKQHLASLYRKFGIIDHARNRRMRLANEALQRGAITVAEIRAAAGRW